MPNLLRTFFLVVVLVNAAFFAWTRYLAPVDPGLDLQPLERQVEPARLKSVSERELARLAPAPAAPPRLKPIPVAPPMAAAVLPAAACLEWGSFSIADTPRAEQALAPLALGTRLGQRRAEETANWWVFMSPAGARAGALRKAAELKALGIAEFHVVQDEGPYQWRISLGVFRTEDAAREYLTRLRAQGVRTAQIGPREMQVTKIWLQIRPMDPEQNARLKAIAQTIPGSEIQECR